MCGNCFFQNGDVPSNLVMGFWNRRQVCLVQVYLVKLVMCRWNVSNYLWNWCSALKIGGVSLSIMARALHANTLTPYRKNKMRSTQTRQHPPEKQPCRPSRKAMANTLSRWNVDPLSYEKLSDHSNTVLWRYGFPNHINTLSISTPSRTETLTPSLITLHRNSGDVHQ